MSTPLLLSVITPEAERVLSSQYWAVMWNRFALTYNYLLSLLLAVTLYSSFL